MNSEIPFPHHNYQTDPLSENFEIISSDKVPPIDEPQSTDVPNAAEKLRAANVAEVMLVHGTFAGNDVLGIVREIARFLPRVADSMRSLGKGVFDQLVGDLGNYTEDFAERFEKLINPETATEIPVSCFNWSGENHHLGRAGGAISLLDRITTHDYPPGARVLVWGHSHGANVLAMLGHLVACSDASREAFFTATKSHYRNPISGRLDLPIWEQVRDRMCEDNWRSKLPHLDVVTFGVPLRYRWQTDLFSKLLHFVQHRPQEDTEFGRAKLPDSIEDVLVAAGGDYVQQLGIGGTDFLHAIIAWRSWNSERRLQKMFEPTVRRRDLAKNLRRGCRVPMEGSTLLVDYADHAEKWNQKLLGHGIYTRYEWLPFHLNEIIRRFY